MRCTESVEAGAYVLGALSPAERATYQRHMATCTECRNEVADLAGLPGLLGRLDEPTAIRLAGPDGAVAVMPPPAPPLLLAEVINKARAEKTRNRRRYRWRATVLAAAAACLALLVGLGGSMAIQQAAGRDRVNLATMEPLEQDEPVTAVIGYQAGAHGGTDIFMSCVYADPPGTGESWTFALAIVTKTRSDTPRTWRADPGEYIHFTAHTDIPLTDIERIEVRLADTGKALLTYEVT
jgi:hypothetical protein